MEQIGWGSRTHQEMQDVLKNPGLPGPAQHYFMLRGGKELGNVTMWSPGLVGDEYVKTFGHYHTWDFGERYEIISGEGIALLQKRALVDGVPSDSIIEDFIVLRLSKGDVLNIPIGYGHLLANTTHQFLISVDNSPSDPETEKVRPHADYEPIRRMHGFAFYLVERNGAPALVANERYSEVRVTDFAGLPLIA